MRDYFDLPICKACNGRGFYDTEHLIHITCEVCGGAGKKWNIFVTIAFLLFTAVTTIGPIWWWLS